MSEFLDDLARSLADPMPRRRAVRIVAGAVVGLTLPGVRRAGAAISPNYPCPKGDFECKCPAKNGLFFRL